MVFMTKNSLLFIYALMPVERSASRKNSIALQLGISLLFPWLRNHCVRLQKIREPYNPTRPNIRK